MAAQKSKQQGKVKKFLRKTWAILSSRVVYTLLSLLIIAGGSYLAIQYARGSWRLTRNGVVANTGLLNANSFPQGAQVYINDKLVTATDDTIYLEPNVYQVRIVKEGYSPWQKELTVQSELVTQSNATLFPIASSLTPLTFTGVKNINPSPDGLKLLFLVDSASTDAKNGFYVLDLSNNNFLSLQTGPRQITDYPSSWDLEQAQVIWSPDSTEVMILAEEREVLISTDRKINLLEQSDITFQKRQLLAQWEEDIYLRERQYLTRFPSAIVAVATESAKNVYLSPDKKRLVYTATAATTIPDDLIPPLPATNTQPEERTLVPGAIYVYDREEDKNFRVATSAALPDLALISTASEAAAITDIEQLTTVMTEAATDAAQIVNPQKHLLADDLDQPVKSLDASPTAFNRLFKDSNLQTAATFANYYTATTLNTLQWFPDSKHLLYAADGKIQIMEYDGYNNTTVYSGPFADSFVYPWPDGSKLLIKTTFSPDSPNNLYVISIK